MTNDQVWYSISKTINLGNYESMKIDVGESRSVVDESPDDVFVRLRKDVNDRFIKMIEKLEKD